MLASNHIKTHIFQPLVVSQEWCKGLLREAVGDELFDCCMNLRKWSFFLERSILITHALPWFFQFTLQLGSRLVLWKANFHASAYQTEQVERYNSWSVGSWGPGRVDQKNQRDLVSSTPSVHVWALWRAVQGEKHLSLQQKYQRKSIQWRTLEDCFKHSAWESSIVYYSLAFSPLCSTPQSIANCRLALWCYPLMAGWQSLRGCLCLQLRHGGNKVHPEQIQPNLSSLPSRSFAAYLKLCQLHFCFERYLPCWGWRLIHVDSVGQRMTKRDDVMLYPSYEACPSAICACTLKSSEHWN